MPALRLTRYSTLKEKLLGPVGTPDRDQFERELAQELAALASTPKHSRQPRLPRQ